MDADGNTTLTYYDGGMETEQAIYQHGSTTAMSMETWGYDQAERQTLHIDPDGNTTVTGYDAAGDTTEQVLYNSGGSAVSTQSWAFDKAGQQTASIDADGNTTDQVYDGGELRRRLSITVRGRRTARKAGNTIWPAIRRRPSMRTATRQWTFTMAGGWWKRRSTPAAAAPRSAT